MNGSFGGRLRRQRESQHITIEQIAAATKIQATLFEGLERDDVSRWPAGIFRRAFIRAYADRIGLDADAVCGEFLERFPEPESKPGVVGAQFAAIAVTPPRPPAAVDAVPAPRVAPPPGPALRLTFADTPLTHAAVRWLPTSAVRGTALTCDALVLLAVALATFVAFGRFWMPLAVASLVYCLGSLLAIRTTPCLWLVTSGWRGAGNASMPPGPGAGETMVYQRGMDSTRARA